MIYRIAQTLSDQIAAAAVFVANKSKNSECAPTTSSMPIMIVNGTEDPMMPYNGGGVSNRKRGEVLSTKKTVQFWLQQNNLIKAVPIIDSLPNINHNDDSYAIRFKYGTNSAYPVVLVQLKGGGHFMPSIDYVVPHWTELLLQSQNNDIEGAHLAWDFMHQFST